MSCLPEELSLQRPALYNPALWSAAELRTYFVARTALLARLVDDLHRETPATPPQHRLILGMRGMGKSTLLRRLALAVSDDADLDASWLPLSFPEEQYNVANLADFWLNCLDALGDLLEARGEAAEVAAIDAEVERLTRGDSESALQALLRQAAKLNRRLILLVDNIDLIFERIKDKDWQLREALQAHPELLLIGASSRPLEASYKYEAAFYDFFKVEELRGLTEEEMRDTILNLARQRGMEKVASRLNADPGRLRVLHTLTGGNPRTAVLLYGVLLKGFDGDVRSDLEGLLDEVTPLYKARFDELPPLSQQLLDKLALHWDPMTARQLTDALGWKVNLVSAQLDRLATLGVVEKVRSGSSKRTAFQVGERFFNIWYLMRAGRSMRRRLMWLVKVLQSVYSNEELQSFARQNQRGEVHDEHGAEYAFALSYALDRLPDVRELGRQAVGSLHPPLHQVAEPDALMQQGKRDESMKTARQLFELSDGIDVNVLVLLLSAACKTNSAGPLLAELDQTEAAQKYRPFREALAAMVAGSADVLYDVAPEVRKPALTILQAVAPELVEAMS